MSEEIKIGDVEIKSFRGIKNYTLKTKGNSIVFCGANGSGKSSFVNAFEFRESHTALNCKKWNVVRERNCLSDLI